MTSGYLSASGRVWPRSGRLLVHHSPEDATEAHMAGGAVDGLTLTSRGPVTQAVVRGAQVGAALGDPARDVRAGLAGCQARLRRGNSRVARRAAGVLDVPGWQGRVVVASPLPDVAGHVEQAVA